jgi:hypothetical protein
MGAAHPEVSHRRDLSEPEGAAPAFPLEIYASRVLYIVLALTYGSVGIVARDWRGLVVAGILLLAGLVRRDYRTEARWRLFLVLYGVLAIGLVLGLALLSGSLTLLERVFLSILLGCLLCQGAMMISGRRRHVWTFARGVAKSSEPPS